MADFKATELAELEAEVRKALGQLLPGGTEAPAPQVLFPLHMAQEMAQYAQSRAVAVGVPIVFSAVDSGGNLLLLHRMDDALLASVEISMNKAFTAAAFRMPTQELGAQAQPGGPLYGLHTTGGGKVVLFGGGLPVWQGGTLAGAIGVSGGTAEQDLEIACFTLQKFKEEHLR